MSGNQNSKIKEKFDEHYKNIDLPICTECNSKNDMIPCVFGKPTSDLATYASMGHVKLMGCCVSSKNPKGFCKKCIKEVY